MRIAKIQTGRPSKDYGAGRKCAYPGCTHTLSRYNPDDICGSHTTIRYTDSPLSIPAEMKICSNCGELKPATTEFFRCRHSRLEAQCKTCVNTKRRARKEAKLEQDGMRRCVVCGKVRAKTLENFQRDENGADGLSYTCVFCIREKES